MKTTSNNPWAARLVPLLDRDTIKQRALVTVPSLNGLRDMPTEVACKLMESALNTVFYPTTQCIEILNRIVEMAYAHCLTTYPDSKEFLTGVYAKASPLPEFAFPILLTGLGGSGKSQIMKAFRRIQVEDSQIIVSAEHSPFPLKGSWNVTVHARSKPTDILRALAQVDGGTTDLIEKCKKMAFRDGIPFLTIDEFQFATGSGNANVQVTQMLLSQGYIGIPWSYNANFSLVSRLMKRPQEDRQRLLSDWIILLPDPPSSTDWMETLKLQQNVCKEVLKFDPVKDAADIHAYSAGIKRASVKLLVIAFRHEHPRGGVVDISAIKRAYHSREYASYRKDVEILATQAITNSPNKKNMDLWCPLPLPPNAAAIFTDSAKKKRDEQVADAELRSSMNKEERVALQQIERDIKRDNRKTAKVLPLRKKKLAPTAEDLKNNANWFKDQL